MPTKIILLLPLLISLSFSSCKAKNKTEEKSENNTAATAATSVSSTAKVGQAAPDFTLKNLNGESVSLSNYKGKVVLLDFWATWCGPCRMSTPALVRLNEKFKDRGLTVLGISMDENIDNVKPFVTEEKVQHNILYAEGSNVAYSYQIEAIPTLYLIDKQGVIRQQYSGYSSQTEQTLEKDILALL